MRKIINVPIEPLEERYSAQWNRWIPAELSRLGVDHIHLDFIEPLSDKIRNGSFLDVIGTNYYKAKQLAELMDLIDRGQIVSGDVILLNDIWFPGLEMLAYVRDAIGRDFKIAGIAHAGTWDPYDFLSQKKMGRWGEDLENSWFEIVDYILVNSHYHKQLLKNSRTIDSDKIFVVGYPFKPEEFVEPKPKKENIVVFPHRLDPEKQPELFDYLAIVLQKTFPDWQFIKTKDVWTNKKAYYDLLNRSKIAFSCALQETFGIAMVEATLCGCIPVVPDRLSYHHLYDKIFKYSEKEEAIFPAQAKLSWMIKFCDVIQNSGVLLNQRRYFWQQSKLFMERVVSIVFDTPYTEWEKFPIDMEKVYPSMQVQIVR